ncbi:MAG: hypothetical protein AUJ92_22075 [Armatimonadetes bacterium CG2_30_59_28]|nr:MAG: hypothetical protein AUJ92_22075 [Armatimonadetes bacterium CG2_30_59_28]PIU60633.1 MAG: hypothetical protein COS85_23500 [Armatimonadetes bacterium CG07_land_8_20_14_0_80_59_28]
MSNGQIAVLTDLPAGATKSWKLVIGKPVAPRNEAVKLTTVGNLYELANSLVALRVTKSSGDPQGVLAPIQGIRYRDGTWTGTGPNYFDPPKDPSKPSSCAVERLDKVELLESGPPVVRVKLTYTTRKGELYSYRDINTGEMWPKSRKVLDAGRASRLSTPGLSGVAVDTRPEGEQRVASIRLSFQRLMPTQYYAANMRFVTIYLLSL